MKPATAAEAVAEVIALPPPAPPRTRAGCIDGPRPCPAIGCKHHLRVDATASVQTGGRRRRVLPLLTDMLETCALDVASRGGVTLEEVGDILGVVRERVRQIEAEALRKLKARGVDLRVYLERVGDGESHPRWNGGDT